MKNLSKEEKMVIEMFGANKNYSLHRCDEHGVQAHKKDSDYNGCIYCKKHFPEQTKEQLLS